MLQMLKQEMLLIQGSSEDTEIREPAENVNEKGMLEDFTDPEYKKDKEQNQDQDVNTFLKLIEGFDAGVDNRCNQERAKAGHDEDDGTDYGDSDDLRSIQIDKEG